MSSHYNTEPPPSASVTLHTTVGPIHISLFAKQTPLASKNFLQHCLDGYYTDTVFHRVVPNFVIQAGDPSGTGSGGVSIYEDPEFEYDPEARDPNEKVVFGDEVHSRLRFNRRGLVGMVKMGDDESHAHGTRFGAGPRAEQHLYGSQFFITLANAERELNGKCTMFGRVEGESIYNVVKIAEAELVEGTDRPVYAVKITGCEVAELGPFEGKLKKRPKKVATQAPSTTKHPEKKKKKGKAGKALLSFGEEGDEDVAMVSKPKFNTKLVTAGAGENMDVDVVPAKKAEKKVSQDLKAHKKSQSPIPGDRRPSTDKPYRPKTPDPYAQMPLPDPEEPERTPTPESPASREQPQSKLDRTKAEIASLKASMRRNVTAAPEPTKKRSALEAMIPETAIRGRKRQPLGDTSGRGGTTGQGYSTGSDADALKLFNAFKAKLESADAQGHKKTTKDDDFRNGRDTNMHNAEGVAEDGDDEEAQLCDLHFIANCQSCRSWDEPEAEASLDSGKAADEVASTDWMTHKLQFGKDTLGKDLSWKKEHEDADSLMVIDPREKEKEIVGQKNRHGHGRRDERDRDRNRERERKRERASDREWDRRG